MYTSPDMYEKYHINHNKSLNFNFDNSCAQDSHKLAKTRKTSQTKHSLKYLLSPPKQVSTL